MSRVIAFARKKKATKKKKSRGKNRAKFKANVEEGGKDCICTPMTQPTFKIRPCYHCSQITVLLVSLSTHAPISAFFLMNINAS
jgi:hypothetical protein